jgi:hypothetical protein
MKVRLFGRFRIYSETGCDLTPKGAKAQALLALLLTSETFDRGRLWLQDKLWSDRAHAQGSASLRQALTEIRRSFGMHADILDAGRKTISLDADRVQIEPAPIDGRSEFLEGLDVRDDEFNLWLASQRAQMPSATGAPIDMAAPLQTALRPVRRAVVFLEETQDTGPFKTTETLFVDSAARSLTEQLDVDVYRRIPALSVPGLLMVSVQAFAAGDTAIGVRVSLEDVDTSRLIWSDTYLAPFDGTPNIDDDGTLALGNRLVMQLRQAVMQMPVAGLVDPDANLMAAMAVRKMFSMRKADLIAAEGLLNHAYEVQKRGVFKSWLAQLYSIQYVERIHTIEDIRDKSEASCAHALELEPNNSHVLSSVADANLVVKKNLALSAQLAQMSVRANPANPMAWWTQASAHLYHGDARIAHEAAIKAQALAQGTRLQFWTDIQRGLAAIVNGKTLEGVQLLESSSALAPGFHPPLRYLTALYSAAGMAEQAQASADKLRTLEPDFTFERLANDTEYPVSLMRKHGMLDAVDLL